MNVRRVLAVLAGLVVLGLAGSALMIRAGLYNVSATRQHTGPVFWILNQTKIWSIRERAEEIKTPDLSDQAMVARGERAYHRHCTQCHGAPGIAPEEVGRGMTPVPPNLAETARKQRPAEIFWVIKHGIRSTGMPAWDYRMPDARIWEIVAFVARFPTIVPAEYRRRFAGDIGSGGGSNKGAEHARAAQGGDSQHSDAGSPSQAAGTYAVDLRRGRLAIQQYACTACHVVPGIPGSDTRAGPPLAGIGARAYIAGVLPNTSANMVRWLQDPIAIDPLTAMPDLGVSPAHARDMAAYLATLSENGTR